MEHLGDARKKRRGTDLGDHMLIVPTSPTSQAKNDDFEIKILDSCKDEANLKITESIEITNNKKSLNKNMSSWRLLKPVPYSSS